MKAKTQIETLHERPKTEYGQSDFCIIQTQTNVSSFKFLKNIVRTIQGYTSIGICPTDEKLHAYSYQYFSSNTINKSQTTIVFSWYFDDIWTGKSRNVKIEVSNNTINNKKNRPRNIVDPTFAQGLYVSSVIRYFQYLYSHKIEERLINSFIEMPFKPDNFSFDTFLQYLVKVVVEYPKIGKQYNQYSIISAMTKHLKLVFKFIKDYCFIETAVTILNRLFFEIDGFKFNRALTIFYLQLASLSKKSADLAIIQILQNQLPNISKYYLGNCKGKKTKQGFQIVNCISYQNKLQIWMWLGESLAYKFQWEKSLNCYYNACKLLNQEKQSVSFKKLVQLNEFLQWNCYHQIQKHPISNRILKEKQTNSILQYQIPCRKLQRFNSLIKNYMNLSETEQIIIKSLIKFVEIYFHKNIVVKNRVIDIRTTLNHFRDFIIQNFQGFYEDYDELQQLPEKVQIHEITYKPVIQNDMESMAHISLFQRQDDQEQVEDIGFQGQISLTSSLRKSLAKTEKQNQATNPEQNSPSIIIKKKFQENKNIQKQKKIKRNYNPRFQSLLQLSLSLSRHFYYLKTNEYISRGRYSNLRMNMYDGYLLAEGAKLFNAHKIQFQVRSWTLQFLFNCNDYYRCIELMLIISAKAKESNESTKQYMKTIFNMILSLYDDYNSLQQERNPFRVPYWLRILIQKAYNQDDKNFQQEIKTLENKNKTTKQKYENLLKQIKNIVK